MTFKDHFSGHAAVYREARPSYPDALFDWIAANAPDRGLVWDTGCGNGQASVALAERFDRVVATDPSATQIANAERRANIDYRVEPGEKSSLDDASASIVTVAQALHWFDLERFYPEVKRVLKPNGLIVVWSYADCSVTPPVDAVKNRLYVDVLDSYWPPERRHVDAGYRTLPFSFREIDAPPFAMRVTWDLAQFESYLRSWSATQRYQRATGDDPVARLAPEFAAAWGRPAEPREVRWDFTVRAGRV
jgi:SAM-dependent methyltransferase